MNFLLKINTILILLLIVAGCSNKVHTKIETVEVKVPVVYKIDRPNRPRYMPDDTIPSYVNKLITYTEILEVLIDEHNSKE